MAKIERSEAFKLVVEGDIEPCEVALVRRVHLSDKFLFAATSLASALHDRRAMRVVGTNIDAAVAAHALKPGEDVSLRVFDDMPDVQRGIGVRQSARNQDISMLAQQACTP